MITQVIKSDCGCEFETSPTGQVYRWCPMHKASEDMYEALKLYQEHQQGTHGHYCWKCFDAIEKAIAKADNK